MNYVPVYILDFQKLSTEELEETIIRRGVPNARAVFQAIYERDPSEREEQSMHSMLSALLMRRKFSDEERILLNSEFGLGQQKLIDSSDKERLLRFSYDHNRRGIIDVLNKIKVWYK